MLPFEELPGGVSVVICSGPDAEAPAFEADLLVDTGLYGRDALFQACYAFTDRCFLFLEPDGPERVRVRLRRRESDVELADLLGDFGNELVNQRVRIDLFRRTHRIRELIVSQAFTEADLAEPDLAVR